MLSHKRTIVIDEARVLSLTVLCRRWQSSDCQRTGVALSAVLALAGIALLVFWRSSRGREYCGPQSCY